MSVKIFTMRNSLQSLRTRLLRNQEHYVKPHTNKEKKKKGRKWDLRCGDKATE